MLTRVCGGFLGFSAFEDSPWVLKLVEFVKGVLAAQEKEEQPGRGIRIVGVCFGHQIVGRAMGAKVARSDRGWEASVCEVELTEKGKEIFGKEKLVCFGLGWALSSNLIWGLTTIRDLRVSIRCTRI